MPLAILLLITVFLAAASPYPALVVQSVPSDEQTIAAEQAPDGKDATGDEDALHRRYGFDGLIVSKFDNGIFGLVACDVNGDGQGDLDDLAFLVGCMSGPGQAYEPGCEAADIDGDGDVDMTDFAMFQAAFGCP